MALFCALPSSRLEPRGSRRRKAGWYRVHFADTNLSVATQEDFGGNEVSVCEGNEPPVWVRTPSSTTLLNQMEKDRSRHSDPVGSACRCGARSHTDSA